MLNISPSRLVRAAVGAGAMLALVGVGCAHSAAPKGASAPKDDWTPSAEEDAVILAFSARDNAADCASVEALTSTPVATLVAVAEHVTMPPWVGTRAASCLTGRHAEEAKPTLVAWAGTPDKRGLVILLANELDAMPEAVAVDVARAGLAGPFSEDMRKRLVNSQHVSVRALAAPTP